MQGGYVYIVASKSRRIYIGVTARLAHRMVEHKQKRVDGFTAMYNMSRLVYFQRYIRNAIAREKQLKGWTRSKKVALIETRNSVWRDLSEDFLPPGIF